MSQLSLNPILFRNIMVEREINGDIIFQTSVQDSCNVTPLIHFGTIVACGSRTRCSSVASGSLRQGPVSGSNVARGSSVASGSLRPEWFECRTWFECSLPITRLPLVYTTFLSGFATSLIDYIGGGVQLQRHAP